MALDIELYRRTIYLPATQKRQASRHISVIDIQPEGATHTMVLTHGYGGHALQWLYQLRFFGQSIRVIAPDMRGHGLSDDPFDCAYTMDGLVDDLENVLDALQVQRPFSLVAHSFGGAVSTEYALRHPEDVSDLILVGVPSRFILHPVMHNLMSVPDPIFSFAAKIYGAALFSTQRTLKAMLEHVMAPWCGSERFPQLRVPTLVIMGHRDNVFLREHYDDVPRSIPHSQQVVISVSAHLVQLERPDAVNRAIRRFLDARLAREGSKNGITAGSKHTAFSTINRLVDMPWLQHYDDNVPEQVPLPKQLLHNMLSNNAKAYPHRTALVFFGQKIGYQELDRLSNRFAHALRTLGVRDGDRVAMVLPNVPQCVIGFYGILKAGAIVVMGSPLSSEEELRYQLRDSGATTLLILESYRVEIEQICRDTNIRNVIYTDVREYMPITQRILLASLIEGSRPHKEKGDTLANAHPSSSSLREHSFQPLLRRHPTAPRDGGITSEHIALLQYTSGTTDIPKGVILSHANLMDISGS